MTKLCLRLQYKCLVGLQFYSLKFVGGCYQSSTQLSSDNCSILGYYKASHTLHQLEWILQEKNMLLEPEAVLTTAIPISMHCQRKGAKANCYEEEQQRDYHNLL